MARFAGVLQGLGVTKGDRVVIYLPMIPEAVVAMLACARLGVLHSVVFAGYSATALGARIADAEAKLVITADGQFRQRITCEASALDNKTKGALAGRDGNYITSLQLCDPSERSARRCAPAHQD